MADNAADDAEHGRSANHHAAHDVEMWPMPLMMRSPGKDKAVNSGIMESGAPSKGGDTHLPEPPARASCHHRLLKTVQRLPSPAMLLIMFVLLVGLNMSWVAPSFVKYRAAGNAANSAHFQGWMGCIPATPSTPATPSNTSARPVVLTRYKGIMPDKLDIDYSEPVLDIVLELKPTCPTPGANNTLGRPDEPYLKVTFTMSKITPEEVLASVDIQLEVMNALDLSDASALNRTGGAVTLKVDPALEKNITLAWSRPGSSVVFPANKVNLHTIKPLTNYPWDAYFIKRSLSTEIVLLAQTAFPETRALPMQIWTQSTTQLFQVSVDPGQRAEATMDVSGSIVIDSSKPLVINIVRSSFTKSYAVLIVVMMWFHGGLNLLHILDNVFIRPRPLRDAFAPTLLFALPAFRNTMPGVPQSVGVAIDMIGLVWAEMMVAVCIIISLFAFLNQYNHNAPLFKREGTEAKKNA